MTECQTCGRELTNGQNCPACILAAAYNRDDLAICVIGRESKRHKWEVLSCTPCGNDMTRPAFVRNLYMDSRDYGAKLEIAGAIFRHTGISLTGQKLPYGAEVLALPDISNPKTAEIVFKFAQDGITSILPAALAAIVDLGLMGIPS